MHQAKSLPHPNKHLTTAHPKTGKRGVARKNG